MRTALGHAEGRVRGDHGRGPRVRPADLAKLLRPLNDGEADVVFGTRGFESHSAFSFWYVVGNKGVTLVANLLFNSWLADIMNCYKAMRTEIFRSLDLQSAGFDIEPEITARLLGGGHQIYEVPIRYRARSRNEGKKLTARDGLRVVWKLFKCRASIGPRMPETQRSRSATS